MSKQKFFLIFIFFSPAIIVLFLHGCSQNELLCIDLNLAGYNLGLKNSQIINSKGKIIYINNEISLNEKETFIQKEFTGFNQRFYICVPKNQITPVLVTIDSETPLYSGFLFPFSNEFSVHGAFCAFIFTKLFTNSYENPQDIYKFCSYFNWKKFYEKILTYKDPFSLDSDKILSDIAGGNFSAHSIKLLNN
ncbi:MAG: hypothetical protein ACTTHG_03890 [Treponemataceae bacterium]